MIEMVLAHVDLARVRFAHSPVRELVASLLVLKDPARQPIHGGWLSVARQQVGGAELELLSALAPVGRYLPSFLMPPPTGPSGVLADELAAVAASPPAVVRAELDKVRDGRPLPAVLAPLYEDPAGHLPAVVEQFASGGLARVLAELWREAPANHSDPLAALVGRTRARLLATLGLPRTTSQLAVQFGLSPAAVSQHLKVLKETGLMTARRRGRMVLYQPTAAATTLLEAASSNQQAG